MSVCVWEMLNAGLYYAMWIIVYDLMAYCTNADVDANADERARCERDRLRLALALTASWVPFRCGRCVGDNLRDLIYA